MLFFQNLIAGPDSRRWHSKRKVTRIQSLCEDVMFTATSGRKKPKKHFRLGISMKYWMKSDNFIEDSSDGESDDEDE